MWCELVLIVRVLFQYPVALTFGRSDFESGAVVCSPNHGPRADSIEPQLVTGALYAGSHLRARRVHQDQERVRKPSPILSRTKNLDADIYKVPYL